MRKVIADFLFYGSPWGYLVGIAENPPGLGFIRGFIEARAAQQRKAKSDA